MDGPQHRIIITGDEADATAAMLRERLHEMGAVASETFAVTASSAGTADDADALVYALGAHDTPGFAVEKIIDELAARGWIAPDTTGLSPEEEAQISLRLRELGYIE